MTVTRRQFLVAGGAALATVVGVPLYAWQIEPHWVEIVRHSMRLEHLPPELEGRTLLQISDIHVGPRVSSAYLIETLDRARELAPDFVAFTGDFVTYRSATEYRALEQVLRHAPNGKLGTVAALGNHDYGFGWRHIEVADQISRVAADAGIRVLRNEVATMNGVQFAGLSNVWSPEFGMYGVRAWVLAGHTHGGQVKPPFLPPPVLPVRNKRYVAGELTIAPGRTLYINRGLGHLVQLRFNVRPELTLFTLERARLEARGR